MWQSYKQERRCQTHIAAWPTHCWKTKKSARDNHVLACNLSKIYELWHPIRRLLTLRIDKMLSHCIWVALGVSPGLRPDTCPCLHPTATRDPQLDADSCPNWDPDPDSELHLDSHLHPDLDSDPEPRPQTWPRPWQWPWPRQLEVMAYSICRIRIWIRVGFSETVHSVRESESGFTANPVSTRIHQQNRKCLAVEWRHTNITNIEIKEYII